MTYKLPSENNLKVVTELLVQTLHPALHPLADAFISKTSRFASHCITPSSGSQRLPIVHPFSSPPICHLDVDTQMTWSSCVEDGSASVNLSP